MDWNSGLSSISNYLFASLLGNLIGIVNNIYVSADNRIKKGALIYGALGVGSIIAALADLCINGGLRNIIYIILAIVYIIIIHHVFNKHSRYLSTQELNPIIIKFTSKADIKEGIRLFGGDLDFFGKSPKDMDKNEQYKQLKRMKFKEIHILCEDSTEEETAIRYGKILDDFGENVIMRHYNNDLEVKVNIRGRLQKVFPSKDAALICEKIEENKYRIIKNDINNPQCALFIKIWNMMWENARSNEIRRKYYLDLYMKRDKRKTG